MIKLAAHKIGDILRRFYCRNKRVYIFELAWLAANMPLVDISHWANIFEFLFVYGTSENIEDTMWHLSVRSP